MSSAGLYDKIYLNNKEYLRSGDIEVDQALAGREPDMRLGVSLIIPIRQIHDEYKHLVSIFSAIDPDQYYYNFEDLHITVFDFIHAKKEYRPNALLEKSFIKIAESAAGSIESFKIEMKGVVFTRSAGLIKGFDSDILVSMRKNIREQMNSFNIQNDERYESESAHITFARFRHDLSDPLRFFKAIEENKEIELGEESITGMELVEHDWYNTFRTKRVIEEIKLHPKTF